MFAYLLIYFQANSFIAQGNRMAENSWDSHALGPAGPIVGPGAPNNTIDYGQMMRYQTVSQFQQMMNRSSTASFYQQQQQMYNPRFSTGAQNENWKSYQRQSEANRVGYAGAFVSGGTEFAISSLAMAAVPGFIAGMGASLLAPIVPMAFVNYGVNRTMERQKAMISMANDLDQYRGQIGLRDLTYTQSTMLASDLTKSMYSDEHNPNKFFNAKQQQEMFKIGLSNNMLSAKTKGMVTGDIKQFEKNTKELFEATEIIVKTMNTTLQGGMSIIKEMQMKGFGTVGQIRNSVTQAQGYGFMTGIGAQNILQVGATGANSTAGTTWNPQSGSNMYMMGAAQVSTLARSGISQDVITRLGGIGQAGGAMGQMQMNILKSGMGRWVSAYLMNPTGGLSESAFDRLAAGKVGAYEMVTKGGQNFNNLSPSERFMWRRRQGEMLNDLVQDPTKAGVAAYQTYKTWSQQYWMANSEATAQAFGQMWGGGDTDAGNLLADWAYRPKAFGEMEAGRTAANVFGRRVVGPETEFKFKARTAIIGAIYQPMSKVVGAVEGTESALSVAGQLWNRGGARVGRIAEDVANQWAWGAGFNRGKYGLFTRGSIGNVEQGIRRFYGAEAARSATSFDEQMYYNLSAKQKSQLVNNSTIDTGLKYDYLAQNMSKDQMQYLEQQIQVGMGNRLARNIIGEPRVAASLNLNDQQKALFTGDQAGKAVAALATGLANAQMSASKKAEQQYTYADNYLRTNVGNNVDRMRVESSARYLSQTDKKDFDAAWTERGTLINEYLGKNKTASFDVAAKSADQTISREYKFSSEKMNIFTQYGMRKAQEQIDKGDYTAMQVVASEAEVNARSTINANEKAAGREARELLGLKSRPLLRGSGMRAFGYNLAKKGGIFNGLLGNVIRAEGAVAGLPGALSDWWKTSQLAGAAGMGFASSLSASPEQIVNTVAQKERAGTLNPRFFEKLGWAATGAIDISNGVDVNQITDENAAKSGWMSKLWGKFKTGYLGTVSAAREQEDIGKAYNAVNLLNVRAHKEDRVAPEDMTALYNFMTSTVPIEKREMSADVARAASQLWSFNAQENWKNDRKDTWQTMVYTNVTRTSAETAKIISDATKKEGVDRSNYLYANFKHEKDPTTNKEWQSDTKEELDAALKKLQQTTTATNLPTSQSRGINQSANPPILNYWNNLWAY